MKFIISMIFILSITGCSTTNKSSSNERFYTSYKQAVTAIKHGDYDAAYRHIEKYFVFDGIIKNVPYELRDAKAKSRALLKSEPKLLAAALNTFTQTSFKNALTKNRDNKIRTATLEHIRINTFQKLYPEEYLIAEKQFTLFFGISPDELKAENIKKYKELQSKRNLNQIGKPGTFTRFTAKGNLEVTKPVKCGDVNSLTSRHTPADIFTGVSDCIKNNDITRATRLYALALTYGRYDMLRMKDKSSRGAIKVLQYNHLSKNSKEVQAKLKKEILTHSHKSKDATKFRSLCHDINKLGKPTYYPRYMIRHGMSVFTGGESGILEDFNTVHGWKKAYNDFLKCPST